MTIERAGIRVVPKPWGSTDLRPWSTYHGGGAIGEIWFERTGAQPSDSTLLVKLLFTNEPLSIQVHPDDAFARSIGLAHGKSEAWYVLSATPDARVALGLKRRLTTAQLKAAIDDGSISERVQWRTVRRGDVIFVPPGAIHAIGPGLVIAEIQQRSDTTFRLFDYGRGRELHADQAVAAASADEAQHQAPPRKLNAARTLLVASPHFVLERFELPPGSDWELAAAAETWLFMLDGCARIGPIDAGANEVVFLDADRTRIEVAASGVRGLVAYVGSDPTSNLLRGLGAERSDLPGRGRRQALLQPGTVSLLRAAQARA
ncbi:MAG: class I mannose-6-phosphate isomerase [Steroidobacteraceae bacterium]